MSTKHPNTSAGRSARAIEAISPNSPRARTRLHTQRTHTPNNPVFARVSGWPVVTVSSAGVAHA